MSRLLFAVFDEGGSERPGGQHPQMKLAATTLLDVESCFPNDGKPAGIESCFMSGERRQDGEISHDLRANDSLPDLDGMAGDACICLIGPLGWSKRCFGPLSSC